MAGAFRFGDLAGFGEGGFGMLGDEIERALHDAGHGFAVAVRVGEKSHLIAFA